jgi:SAM-dependent methyltransferase
MPEMIKQRIGGAARRMLPDSVYFGFCRLYDRLAAVAVFFFSLGFARQCPFCTLTFRKFLSDAGEPSELFNKIHVVGGGPSDEAICPFCGSFERERHVYLYLKLMTKVLSDEVRILHIAPERRLSRVLSKKRNIQYTSGDLNPTRAQVRVDLTAIDFPDASFDVVICNHVLEHIPEDKAAMAEILRILRPGGWAMLQVPLAPEIMTREDLKITDPQKRLRLYGQDDHVRIYGRDYAKRLESVGFCVTTASVGKQFGEAYAKRFGLLPDELIYVAGKPDSFAKSEI